MNEVKSHWQTEASSKRFLEGERGAVPLADMQIELMVRLTENICPSPRRIIDLGCGDGILGRTLLNRFPSANITFVDFSDPMLSAAEEKVGRDSRARIVKGDFSSSAWLDCMEEKSGVDLVVSGFAIHHQPDERKRALFKEIFELLSSGGFFVNLEHVASATMAIETVFDGYFVDCLYAFKRASGSEVTREAVEREYDNRPDKKENVLALVEEQCAWLREIGFADVDCFFKIFEVALFGGRKPMTSPKQ